MYAVNVSSRTALTRELKLFEAPFLSTNDPRFSWLKYQILKYLEGWLTTIEVRPGVYEKPEKKNLNNHKSIKDIKIIVHTVTELPYKVLDYA